MSRSIYELTQAQLDVLDRDYWTNEDDEEIKQRIRADYDAIQGEVTRKLEFIVSLLPECKAESQAIREAARLQAKRAQVAERREEKLREFVLQIMQDFGIKKVNSKYGVVNLSSTQVLVLPESLDVDSLPDQFVRRQAPEVRKLELMKFLKECEEVPEELKDCVIWQKPCLRLK